MTIQDSVVVILPRVGERVLMQLRDIKEGIAFPGCWGFFGGSIEPGEAAEAAAFRELREELSWEPHHFVAIGTECAPDLDGLLCHAFTCELTIPPEDVVQNEGMDCALFSLDDVRRGVGYAPRLERSFPMAPNGYMERTVAAMIVAIRCAGTQIE